MDRAKDRVKVADASGNACGEGQEGGQGCDPASEGSARESIDAAVYLHRPGAIGMLCGQCPTGWSRDDYPQPCAPCPADSSSQLAVPCFNFSIQSKVACCRPAEFVRGGMLPTALRLEFGPTFSRKLP